MALQLATSTVIGRLLSNLVSGLQIYYPCRPIVHAGFAKQVHVDKRPRRIELTCSFAQDRVNRVVGTTFVLGSSGCPFFRSSLI